MYDTGRDTQEVAGAEAVALAVDLHLERAFDDVADAAAVSRATAYRYFPTQTYLLAEAALEGVPEQVDRVLEATASRPPDERLDAVVRAIQERTAAQEPGFRALLRLSLEQPFDGQGGPESGGAVRRGARRLDWIERALAPHWDTLDGRTRQQLLGALSLCMGVEALVVLRDVCGYSPNQAVETCRWAARALLRAGLQKAARRGEGD